MLLPFFTNWARRLAFPLLLLVWGCSTTPPPRGLTVVEPKTPPPSREDVASAQRSLRERDLYLGPVDGEFTAETRVAVARFQRLEGLEITGVLDQETMERLGQTEPLPLEEELEVAPEEERELPGAAELLEAPSKLPQPPAGALRGVFREVSREWGRASKEGAASLGVFGEVGGLQEAAGRLGATEKLLAKVRSDAFLRVMTARKEGGWALLPESLEAALRRELLERDLLLHPRGEGWGRDEEEAVRWMERSLQLPQTGEPSLELLEALGIDPSPMFAD